MSTVQTEEPIVNPLAFDPEVDRAIRAEQQRQEHTLELIASENHVSPAVLAAAGSVLTNKYAEGYPGARYYGGCQYHDVIENLARDRAKQLFGCRFANVQPHSGAQANAAVFFALLEPGDTFASLTLSDGGHLSHGMKLNFSGKYFKPVHYPLIYDLSPRAVRADRLRRGAAGLRRTQAEDDPVRLLGVSEGDRLRAVPGDCG